MAISSDVAPSSPSALSPTSIVQLDDISVDEVLLVRGQSSFSTTWESVFVMRSIQTRSASFASATRSDGDSLSSCPISVYQLQEGKIAIGTR